MKTMMSNNVFIILSEAINFLAKVMSVLFRLQGHALRVFEKICTPRCAQVVFFQKTLHTENAH